MLCYLYRTVGLAGLLASLVAGLSCAHDQELQSIEIRPASQSFGATNIPVILDAGLQVQLRALGHYIHPPVTKDITNEVTWASSDTQMVTVNSAGLISATGNVCGASIISATLKTNSDASGRSSSGAIVTGSMSSGVICFTGSSNGAAVLTIRFLGSGTGTVSVSPSGFICSTTCGLSFATGTGPITLTAAANGTFGGWANCPSPSDSTCTINNLSTDTEITATFN